MPGRLQSVACLSEGLAALQLVGIGYNDDFVNGISLLSGFPQQLNASFRTLQRSSAFLRGFSANFGGLPQTTSVFCKIYRCGCVLLAFYGFL